MPISLLRQNLPALRIPGPDSADDDVGGGSVSSRATSTSLKNPSPTPLARGINSLVVPVVALALLCAGLLSPGASEEELVLGIGKISGGKGLLELRAESRTAVSGVALFLGIASSSDVSTSGTYPPRR